MVEIPASSKCKKILEKKEHALIGISPFNSYFSEENIKKLIHWGHAQFKNFHLFVPDTLPYFNFLAIGYPHNKALTKTRRQIKYLSNKIDRAFSSLALSELNTNKEKIITISKCTENAEYNKAYNSCIERYTNDKEFRKKCRDASTLTLKSYTNDINSSMLDNASKYLLGELPFYIDTPNIINIDSSIFVYHENIDFFTSLYKNRDESFVADTQGHLILKLV